MPLGAAIRTRSQRSACKLTGSFEASYVRISNLRVELPVRQLSSQELSVAVWRDPFYSRHHPVKRRPGRLMPERLSATRKPEASLILVQVLRSHLARRVTVNPSEATMIEQHQVLSGRPPEAADERCQVELIPQIGPAQRRREWHPAGASAPRNPPVRIAIAKHALGVGRFVLEVESHDVVLPVPVHVGDLHSVQLVREL